MTIPNLKKERIAYEKEMNKYSTYDEKVAFLDGMNFQLNKQIRDLEERNKRFENQNGFKAENKKQILKDYSN